MINSITNIMVCNNSKNKCVKCVKCEGRGRITIYRNDLEEFEEIPCDLCTLPLQSIS